MGELKDFAEKAEVSAQSYDAEKDRDLVFEDTGVKWASAFWRLLKYVVLYLLQRRAIALFFYQTWLIYQDMA